MGVHSRVDRFSDSSEEHPPPLQHRAAGVTSRDSPKIAIYSLTAIPPTTTTSSQDFAHSEDDIANEVLVSPPLQTMSIRPAMVQPEGADAKVDGVSSLKQFSCPGKRKSLKDLFEDLDVETNSCIRYRRRSMERRSALSLVNHPPFEIMLNDGDDDEAEDPDPNALLVEGRNNSLTAGEKLLIFRSAGLLGHQEERSKGALQARDIMVQKHSSFFSLHMLKRGKLRNEGIGSITHSKKSQRNPDVLRRVSFVEDTKKRRGSIMQVEKLLEPVSNTIRRTASFLGVINAVKEPEETNTLRRVGDTQTNTIGRTTPSLSLFKAGNPGEEQEENVLLETTRGNNSMNLVNSLQEETSRGAMQKSISPEGTGISKYAGLIGPTRHSSFRGISSLSDKGARTSSKDHARDIMVQKRSSFAVSLDMLKRGKLRNEGIESIQRNPEVLRRVSFVEDTKKRRGSVMHVEKLLEPVSSTIRRTASFLGVFNAAGEDKHEQTNTLRRIGDTQSNNTIGRTTSFLSLFKAGNPGEQQEENVLLETMKTKDSMNLVNALNESWG